MIVPHQLRQGSNTVSCSSLVLVTLGITCTFPSLVAFLHHAFEHQTCIKTAKTQRGMKADGRMICASDRRKRGRNVTPSQFPCLAFHLWHFLVNAFQIVAPFFFFLSCYSTKKGQTIPTLGKFNKLGTPDPLPSSLCFENSWAAKQNFNLKHSPSKEGNHKTMEIFQRPKKIFPITYKTLKQKGMGAPI